MVKTAYDATNAILDINENIEALKSKNMGNTPDLELCKSVELLTDYRNMLTIALKHTELQIGTTNYID